MAVVVLDRSGVLAVVRKRVAAGMAQHVAINEEREPSSLAGPSDHALIAGALSGAPRSLTNSASSFHAVDGACRGQRSETATTGGISRPPSM
jgi:hypothetical protein